MPPQSLLRTAVSSFPFGMIVGFIVVGISTMFFSDQVKNIFYEYFLVGLVGIFVGALTMILVILLFGKRIGIRKSDKIIELRGIQELPFTDYTRVRDDNIEVFYDKPFKCPPNLTLNFPKPIGNRHNISQVGSGMIVRPAYKIVEQRPDGFVFKVVSFKNYEPVVEWIARGQPLDEDG